MPHRRIDPPNLRNVCVGDVEHVVFVDDAEDVGREKLELPVAVALRDWRTGVSGSVDAPSRLLPRRLVFGVVFVRIVGPGIVTSQFLEVKK